LSKELAQQEKEHQCCEKQDLKRKKAMEREEGRLARLATREEAAHLKELQAAE
jgi:hypothetical protein